MRFAVAHRALAAGVDGVFCYDHLWPIGQPDRPALAPFPILATLAASVRQGRRAPAVGRSSGRWWPGRAWCPTPCCWTSSPHWPTWRRAGSSPDWAPGIG